MHVALDGGNNDFSLGFDVFPRFGLQAFFFLDVGDQMRHGLLHHPRTFHHLRQKHLALAKQIAHDIHTRHEWAFDHVQGPAALGQDALVGLFGVFHNEVCNARDQCVAEPRRYRNRSLWGAAPLVLFAGVFGPALGGLGNLHQALARIGAAVEHHVLHPLAQHGFELVIDADHARVDDAHVHARLDGVVQKYGVNGLAHRVVAPEAKAHIAHPARHLGTGQIRLDPARGFNEVHRIVVVLFNARGHSKNVGVKNNVFRRKVQLIDQDAIRPLADFHLALVGVGLAFFVKGHDHGGRAVALEQSGLVLELLHTLLHADRIDDALALDAAQPRLDHLPLGAVHHDRHAGDVGLAGDQVQKAHHGGLAVQHGLVHIDVDDLRTVFHLLASHCQGLLKLAVQDHAGEGFGAGDIGALADVHECGSWGQIFSSVPI